jgi:CheY-like chemotaxis protein
MPKRALLVEDDEEQIEFTRGVLTDAGFHVLVARSAGEATAAAGEAGRPIDLIILDRRLPPARGDEPTDGTGDRLLDALVMQLPDTPFVVFSGYTGVPHVQFATRGRGVIPIGPGGLAVDRVTPFSKAQSLEFASHVRQIATQIDDLDDVEADCDFGGDPLAAVSRRLLKRVAVEFGARSISARPLSGGLTDAALWLCQLTGSDGLRLATLVVKRSKGGAQVSGGLHTLMPAAFVAAPVAVVAGMCDGYRASVMQVAGHDAVSLMTLLVELPEEAAGYLRRLSAALLVATADAGSVVQTLEELSRPLGEWAAMEVRLQTFDVELPRRSMVTNTRVAAQHGDLHPGNILVAGGQPMLIDFDSEVSGSCSLDPITALLSPIFHVDSPLRKASWPTPKQCSEVGSEAYFLNGPCESWMRVAWEWVQSTKTTDREMWMLVLAFAARQLKYPDVLEDDLARSRAVALAKVAADRLRDT